MAQLTRERREKEREKPFSLISVFPCVIRVLMKQVMSWMGAGRRCSVALARLEDQPPPPPPPVFGAPFPFWGAGCLLGHPLPPPALRCHPHLPRQRSAAPGMQGCKLGVSRVMSWSQSQPCSRPLETQAGAGMSGSPKMLLWGGRGGRGHHPHPTRACADPSGRWPPRGRAVGRSGSGSAGPGAVGRPPIPGHAKAGGFLLAGGLCRRSLKLISKENVLDMGGKKAKLPGWLLREPVSLAGELHRPPCQ